MSQQLDGALMLNGRTAAAAGAVLAGCRYVCTAKVSAEYRVLSTAGPALTLEETHEGYEAVYKAAGASAAGARALAVMREEEYAQAQEAVLWAARADIPMVILILDAGESAREQVPAQLSASAGILSPASVEELLYAMGKAFDLADRLGCPIMVFADRLLTERWETLARPIAARYPGRRARVVPGHEDAMFTRAARDRTDKAGLDLEATGAPHRFVPPRRTPAPEVRELTPEDFFPAIPREGDPGCARILLARDLREALSRFGVRPKDLLLVSGSSADADLTRSIRSYAVRLPPAGVMPFSTGAGRANPGLTCVAVLPHSKGAPVDRFLQGARANADVVSLVINGGCGDRDGLYDDTVADFAKTGGADFIGRVVPGDSGSVAVLSEAFAYKGFSIVDVVGTCRTCEVNPAQGDVESAIIVNNPGPGGKSRSRAAVLEGSLSAEERDKLWKNYS